MKDVIFLKYMLAVIYVESRFNHTIVSEKEAYGLMQMTAPAAQDAQILCKLRKLKSMNDLFDSATNIRYGTCYLNKLLTETNGDWTQTLIAYNGGYRQLTRYLNGETLAPETANYVLQVQRALNICSADATGSNGGID